MGAPPGPEVQSMFGDIAPVYDRMNRWLSFGIDRLWRRKAVRVLEFPENALVMDVCCGTGDLAHSLAASGCRVVGADFTHPMLGLARDKGSASPKDPVFLQADAQQLPHPDGLFDGVTIAFGIRNVFAPQQALSECYRVLRPGGHLGVLEFFPIPHPLWRGLFGMYFGRVLPLLGKLTASGRRTDAYRYLPDSVDDFVSPQEFQGWMRAVGFCEPQDTPLTGGVARLLLAQKPLT